MSDITPRGFTDPLPATSGLIPGTVQGEIDPHGSVSQFFYVKTIFRDISPADSVRGAWTIQIRQNADPDSAILFDQSIDVGITMFSLADPMFGIGEYLWFWTSDFGLGPGKFKTRICDGQPVPAVIEPYTGPADPVPPFGAPDAPGPVRLQTLKEISIEVVMPDLPANASITSAQLALWAAPAQTGPWTKIGTGLQPGQVVTAFATQVGAPAPEDMWFRAEAFNADGGAFGPRLRDVYTELLGDTQIGGYEGWKHVGAETTNPTVFSEQARNWDPGGGGDLSLGGYQIIATWTSPAYKCALPSGAVVHVIHDNWAAAVVIRDQFTFAFGYLQSAVTQMLFNPATRESFAFYTSGGALRCARVRSLTGFLLLETRSANSLDAPVLLSSTGTSISATKTWAVLAGTFPVIVALQGNTGYITITHDRGDTWEPVVAILTDTNIMGLCGDPSGGCVWGFGQATATASSVNPASSDAPVQAGNYVRFVIRLTAGPKNTVTWSVTERAVIQPQGVPFASQVLGVTCPGGDAGTAWVWFSDGQNVNCFETTDYMTTWVSNVAGNLTN